MKNRRREIRVLEENKVVLIARAGAEAVPEKTVFYGLTKDLSPGGVCILIDSGFSVDTSLKIEIALPGSASLINARGKVKWLKPLFEDRVFEIGLEFTDISPEDRTLLLEHIYRNLSKSR